MKHTHGHKPYLCEYRQKLYREDERGVMVLYKVHNCYEKAVRWVHYKDGNGGLNCKKYCIKHFKES